MCLRNWHEEENYLLQFFWGTKLPSQMRTYRGNLTLKPAATPDDHRQVRQAFMRHISRWQRRNNKTFAIRCYSDYTSHHGCHYDFVAYANDDVPIDRIKALVSQAWERAGGLRGTCKPLHEDDQAAWSVYTTKARKADKRRYRYCPVNGGLEYTWGSNGFFSVSRTALKKEWIKVTFPTIKTAKVVEERPITISKISSPSADQNGPSPPSSFEESWGEIAGDSKAMKYHEGFKMDETIKALHEQYPNRLEITDNRPVYIPVDPTIAIKAILPSDPMKAIKASELASKLGWDLAAVDEAILHEERLGKREIAHRMEGKVCLYWLRESTRK